MSYLPTRRNDSPVFIQKRVEPAPVPDEIQDKQNKATSASSEGSGWQYVVIPLKMHSD